MARREIEGSGESYRQCRQVPREERESIYTKKGPEGREHEEWHPR